jgi:transcription initiation factor TFIID subunit 1, fungi type
MGSWETGARGSESSLLVVCVTERTGAEIGIQTNSDLQQNPLPPPPFLPFPHPISMLEEDDDIINQSIRGFGLSQILHDLQLPHSSSLDNQLGLTGLSDIPLGPSSTIHEDGDAYVDDVEVSDEEPDVKMEIVSPVRPAQALSPPQVGSPQEDLFGDLDFEEVNELVEPPKKKRKKVKEKREPVRKEINIAELFPSFRENAVLDFTELFKGRAVRKPRTRVKPFYGKRYPIVMK